MSISRMAGGYTNPPLAPGSSDRASIDESTGNAIHAPAHGAVDVDAARRSTERVPAQQAPPGTNPALWSVLTHEERSFFAAAQPEGSPTYGPTGGGRIAPGASLGSRIDLTV